ncbi:DUF4352 domain-containing protein [Priestia megaterium]
MDIWKSLFCVMSTMIIIGAVMSGCNSEEADIPFKESEQDKVMDQVPPKDKLYKEGDTVQIQGMEITIDKATYTPPDSYYSNPEKGNILTLDVTVKKTTDMDLSLFLYDFTLKDYQGNEYSNYTGYEDLGMAKSHMKKNKEYKGKMYFDVTGYDSFELTYKGYYGAKAKFNIVPVEYWEES